MPRSFVDTRLVVLRGCIALRGHPGGFHLGFSLFVYIMGPVRTRHHGSHDFGWQSSHSVDLAGWQAKMASIEIWIP